MKVIYPSLLFSAVAMLAVTPASADTFTWNQAAGGAQSWNTAANWNPVAVPNPATGDTVDFSTLNILANTALTLEADRTAEIWKFGDTSGSTTWTVNAGNSIILAGATPTIQVNNGSVILKSVVDGTQGLTKTNGGTLILEATNTYTGNTTISGGTLQIGSNNTSGSTLGNAGTYTGDVSIASGAKLIFNTNTSQELTGVISGAGTLQKGGSGTLILSGANTYTGKTTIAASGAGGPTLSVSSFNSVNSDGINPGTPSMTSSSLGAPTTIANGTIDLGSGSNVRSPTLIYTGSGETTDRVINVSFNSSSKPRLTANTTGGGLLKFTSAFTINPSSGTTSGGLTLDGSGDGEIAAGMSGPALPGYLDKEGGGTWTIGGTTNANSSTIRNGSLIVNGTLNVTTTLTVNSGATLGGSGSIGGAVTVSNGGNLSVGNSPGQMIITDSLTLGATSNTLMELGGTTLGTQYDNLTMDALATALTYGGNLDVVNFGAFDMDGSSHVYDLFSLNGITPTGDFASVTVNSIALSNSGGLWTGSNGSVDYSFDQSLGDLSIVVIPEPSSLVLLGGFGALLILRRRVTGKGSDLSH